jgi:DNA repair exonuclease SbcCD nuclease subunit
MQHWSFVHVTDTHIGSPKSFRFQPRFNEHWQTARAQIVDLQPELLLHGGDLARDGNIHTYELEAVRDDLQTLPFPFHVVPGNMDTGNKHIYKPSYHTNRDDRALNITSEQLRHFESVFGTSNWSFVHKNVRFSGFCDMILGSGLPEEEPLWQWLQAQADAEPMQYHVWMMHSAPFVERPDEPDWDPGDPHTYHDWYFAPDLAVRSRLMEIFRATDTTLVLSGHVHCRKRHIAEGIQFDINPSTAFGQWGKRWPDGDDSLGFVHYTVSDDGLQCRFVPLSRTSDAEGYGPGGHPLPHQRDYSIAWEPGGNPQQSD